MSLTLSHIQRMLQAALKVVETDSVTTVLPDGSGFFTASYELPPNHWLYEEENEIPVPLPMGPGPRRQSIEAELRMAARYAIRASTMNGKVMDFDPDAMVQNFIIGMFRNNTECQTRRFLIWNKQRVRDYF